MDFTILKKGLESYELKAEEVKLAAFEEFYKLLVEVNQQMNLTTVTEWEDVEIRHFLDSLAFSLFYKPEDCCGKRILDLGTGAGFPGIPIAILYPEAKLVLVDSLQKRVHFLERVRDELSLNNVEIYHGRAEDLARDPSFRESFDLAVSRAVSNLSTLSEYCLPFVKVGGAFLSYKSEDMEEEKTAAEKAIAVLGGEIKEVRRFRIPESDYGRTIIYVEKKKASPAKYPRKAGIPQKKPICGERKK